MSRVSSETERRPSSLPLGGIAASVVLLGFVGSASAQADSCTLNTRTVTEDFDTTDFLSAVESSVTGWGSGSITLRRKGDTLRADGNTIGLRVTAVATADWNGDGFDDLIGTVLDTGCHLHFLRNEGLDTNGVPLGFDAGGDPGTVGFDDYRVHTPNDCSNGFGVSILSGDFDGDDDQDLVFVRGGNNVEAYFYEYTGISGDRPVFAAPVQFDTRLESQSEFRPRFRTGQIGNYGYATDWDGDGYDDIILNKKGNGNDTLVLWRANPDDGSPLFGDPVILLEHSGLQAPVDANGSNGCASASQNNAGLLSIALSDTDTDGDLDILTAGVSDAKIAHWRNDGSGSFTQLPDISFPYGGLTFIAVSDFDGDGDPDIFAGKERYGCNGKVDPGTVYYFNNRGNATFELREEPVLDIGNDVDTGVVLNLDNDANGSPDFFVSDGNNTGTYGFVAPELTNVFNLSGRAQSLIMAAPTNEAIVSLEVNISDNLPAGTGYDFYVSNDNGLSWELVDEAERYGGTHNFVHFGETLRWRADMRAPSAVLTSDELAFAPAAKSSPRIDQIDISYQTVDKRQYSRSGLAVASAEKNDGTSAEIVVSAAFDFPGFDGFLSAYEITDVQSTTTDGQLESITQASSAELLWEAGALLRDRGADDRTIYAGYDSAGDGGVSGVADRFAFTTSNRAVFADESVMTDGAAGTLISQVRAGMLRGGNWKLLDPGHSTPIFVGTPNTDGNSPYYSANGYPAFRLDNADRDRRIYLATNGGMIHSFNADNGTEEWAYIPNNLLPRLKDQATVDDRGDYSFRHRFLVDGQQTVVDVRNPSDSSWKTVLISGQGQGAGRGDNNYFFALDITNPDNPLPMWEYSDSWNNGLLRCSGEATQEDCVTSCTETCDDSCTRIDHVFIPSSPGDIWIEAENTSTNFIVAAHEWVTPPVCPTGSSGGCLNVSPDDGGTCTASNFATCGAHLSYSVAIEEADDYDIWVRGAASPAGSNSVMVEIGGSGPQTISFPIGGTLEWAKAPLSVALAAEGQSLSVYMQDAGVFVDKLLVTRNGFTPSGDGVAETCNEQCSQTNCSDVCTSVTYSQTDEWPECGVGSNMRCCLNEPNVCRPIGDSCTNLTSATGETWSKPVVAPVRVDGNVRFLAFFGSGYNNLTQTPDIVGRSLYALDVLTGEEVARWTFNDLAYDSSDNVSTIDNTLPGSPSVADIDDDGIVDRVYIGDLEGRMWKVDVSASGTRTAGLVPDTVWPACVLFDAGDVDENGVREWAPIITRPGVGFPDGILPNVYFGTGGDDRAPDDLRYRYFSVRDDTNCPGGTSYTPLVTRADLSITEFEWDFGDGLETDMSSSVSPSDKEGEDGDKFWSDPLVVDNQAIYFSSLSGSIEEVNTCLNLDGDRSKVFALAIKPVQFGDGTRIATGQTLLGENVFFAQASTKVRQAAITRSGTENLARPNSGVAAGNTDVLLQEFTTEGGGEVAEVKRLRIDNIQRERKGLRVLRWREIPL